MALSAGRVKKTRHGEISLILSNFDEHKQLLAKIFLKILYIGFKATLHFLKI